MVGQSEPTAKLLCARAPGKCRYPVLAQLLDQDIPTLFARRLLLGLSLEFQRTKLQDPLCFDPLGLLVPKHSLLPVAALIGKVPNPLLCEGEGQSDLGSGVTEVELCNCKCLRLRVTLRACT